MSVAYSAIPIRKKAGATTTIDRKGSSENRSFSAQVA